jgi:pimeloyl-ACP methyl ester carboxylesterase
LIPHAEKIIFDDCGHFMAIDKAEETAESIMNFFDRHCNYNEKQLTIPEFA